MNISIPKFEKKIGSVPLQSGTAKTEKKNYKNNRKNKSVVIVGGGTAGWMCAAYLSKKTDFAVKLIYSSDIPVIGVGESTTPHVIAFMQSIGIDIQDFVAKTGASFKYANKLVDWMYKGQEEYVGFDLSYPLKSLPYPKNESQFSSKFHLPLLSDALIEMNVDKFDKYFNTVYHYCDKNAWGNNYLTNRYVYALHLDAHLVSEYIKDKFIDDVQVYDCKVKKLDKFEHGIKSITLENDLIVEGDLFVDASGLRRILMSELDVSLIEYDHAVNSAFVKQVPYRDKSEIRPYTETIKRDMGWEFKIYLQNRYGNGYVHHSKDSEKVSEKFGGKYITWNPGRLQNFQKQNCFAIGLSAGFIDPLEGNGLYLLTASITKMHKALNGEIDFNYVMACMFDNVYKHIQIFYNNDYDQKSAYFEPEYDTEALLNWDILFPQYMWLQKAIMFNHEISHWPVREGDYSKAINYLLLREATHRINSEKCVPYHIGLEDYISKNL